MAGRFITLEGGEGVGKTTNLKVAADHLEARGLQVLITREPGGTPLAEEIRGLLLGERAEPVSPMTEALLIFAARAQHFETVIEPALDAGTWVLCDRFTDSTFAYQGGGRGISMDILERLAALVHGGRWPDLTIYLDAPVDVALARVRGRAHDRFETEEAAFFERVRAVYRELAAREARICLVDAGRSLAEVRTDVVVALDASMTRWGA